MAETRPRFSLRAELREVSCRFSEALVGLGVTTTAAASGITPHNIAVALPFFLIEGFPFERDLACARVMSLGNAFGAAHFLAQDGLMDRDSAPSPGPFHLADRSFTLFLREYSRLFPPDSVVWEHFDRYLAEYFDSLRWEREHLWGAAGAPPVTENAFHQALPKLGRKMAPLKITCAASALLAGKENLLGELERVVEDYHAAYQLSDDMEDAVADAAAGRWSLALWAITEAAGMSAPPSRLRREDFLRIAMESGALAKLAGEIDSRYARAIRVSTGLGLGSLKTHLVDRRLGAGRYYGWLARRTWVIAAAGGSGDGAPVAGFLEGGPVPVQASAPMSAQPTDVAPVPVRAPAPTSEQPPDVAPVPVRAPAPIPEHATPPANAEGSVHWFEVGDDGFVFDIGSGLLFEADPVVIELLSWEERGRPVAELDAIRMNHGASVTAEAVGELSRLAARDATLFADDDSAPAPRKPPGVSLSSIASIAINVTDGCNLSCDYCYSGSPAQRTAPRIMPPDVALGAVDLLMEESFGETDLSIVFFGGEPLLGMRVIETVIDYARDRARAESRELTFHVTTNGTLLTPDVAAFLQDNGVRTLVSIDGPRDDHDAHRVFSGGRGSYDTIASNVRSLPPGVRASARATLCEDSRPVPEIVSHLKDLGLCVVQLSPVSGRPMSRAFAERLCLEFEDAARAELECLSGGGAPAVGNFVEPILAMETGTQRFAPCGAGARYVSVAPDGVLYLCHRFGRDPHYAVGSVTAGLDRGAVGRLLDGLLAESDGCGRCWARFLCGGPCYFDLRAASGEGIGQDSPRCVLRRRVLELSMWLYASLPPEQRARLTRFARTLTRPELEAPAAAARPDSLPGQG